MLKSKLIKKLIALLCAGVVSSLCVVASSAYVIDTGELSGSLGNYRVSGSVSLFENGASADTYCSYSNAGRSVSVEYVYSVDDVVERSYMSQASPTSTPIASITDNNKRHIALAAGGKHEVGFSGYSWKRITKAGQDRLVISHW